MTTNCRNINYRSPGRLPLQAVLRRWFFGGFAASFVVGASGCILAPEKQMHGVGFHQTQYLSPHQFQAQSHHPAVLEHQVGLARHNGSAVRVPANYTHSLKPDLATVELARWWEAFQSEPLQQILGQAASQPSRYSSQHTLPSGCNEIVLAGPNASQAKHHLELYARNQHLAETGKTYFDLALAKERLQLSGEHRSLSEQLLQLARQRYEEGDVGRADVLLAEAALGKQQALNSELAAEWTTIHNRLRSIVGFEVPTNQLDGDAILSFPRPLLVDLGQPSDLLVRHHDLIALKAGIDSPQNGTLATEKLLHCYQALIDRYYATVEVSSNQLGLLTIESVQLEETSNALRESYQLTMDQYALGRARILDVLKVQDLWLQVAERRAANYHQFLVNHLELYVAAGGGDANVAAKPNRVAKLNTAASSDRIPPNFFHEVMAECSLLAPAEGDASAGQIVLLPPRERIDELGKGTVTVVSLGSPLTDASVQPNNGQAPKTFPQDP